MLIRHLVKHMVMRKYGQTSGDDESGFKQTACRSPGQKSDQQSIHEKPDQDNILVIKLLAEH